MRTPAPGTVRGTAPAGPGHDPARLAEARRAVAGVRRRGRVRALWTGGVLAVLVFALLCLSLCVGDYVIPLGDVLGALFGGGDAGAHFVVIELRLPRALLAVLVGAAFGMAGGVFQTVLRNPLASPDVIGISSGASAAAVLGSLVLSFSGLALSGAALFGALAAGTLIYTLSWRGGVVGARFVLIGIGVGTGLLSVLSYLLTTADVDEAQEAFLWMTGSLNGRSWTQFWPLLWLLAVLVPLTLAAARALPALSLGDDTAAGLGSRVGRRRLALLACGTVLAGAATAAAGPVAFVAFVAAPVARMLLPGRGAVLPHAALTGALLVLVADFAAQHAIPGIQFPVGIVTSLVGAPYLLWLLARANRVGRGG
ncbi:FecCD family ABC transporter permease [Streptomyces sp. SPB074]|uniref:FecCD family ABC transporter permease n=1 Tax=Streptomyces sp. (strain SPB074) TaxID=465543 RepID=UPI00017F10F5|nr:ABC-type Fe3+-siderophore transport system, permease component [Streptomyces sp. SPB074]